MSATGVPRETRILAITNQKGGVGKTTTAVNVSVALALQGKRVLCLDLDPQGNASTGLGVPHPSGTPSTYEVLIAGRSLAEVAVPAPDVDGLLVVPATIDLAGAEIELVSVVARETRLKRALGAFAEPLDYVLIDCPPSLGLLTINALVAAREVFIPIQCEYYALEGLSQLLRTVELVRAHLNPDLCVSTILMTMYDARTRLADDVIAQVREHFGDVVLPTVIPRNVRVSEAPGYGQSVLSYDPASRGALAYAAAAAELAVRLPGVAPGGDQALRPASVAAQPVPPVPPAPPALARLPDPGVAGRDQRPTGQDDATAPLGWPLPSSGRALGLGWPRADGAVQERG